MMRGAIMLALAVTLAACANVAQTGTTERLPALPAGSCDAAALRDALGKTATRALGADLLGRSGARTLRWVPPRAVLTMDYRQDRLDIAYDDAMAITRIYCG